MFARLSFFVVILALAGCGPGITVTKDVDTKIDKDLRTYDFKYDADNLSNNQRALNRRVRDLIQTQLAAKGYEQVSASPDFVVGQFGAAIYTLEDTEDPDDVAKRQQQQRLLHQDPRPDQAFEFDESRLQGHGTLLIYMTDPQTGEVFWRSRAEADLAFEGQGAEKVDQAVELLMKDFPSR